MKKILLISAIVFILLLLAGWGYLLLNGAPEGIPGFGTTFDPAESADTSTSSFAEESAVPVEALPTIDTTRALIQLSTKPVAGAVFVSRDGGEYVRFVERGTGHIYEISLSSGATSRISNTTIPRTTDAVWSPAGTRVALTSEIVRGTPEVVIGTLVRGDSGEQSLETFSLEAGAENVSFLNTSDVFYYTVRTGSGSTGYRYDLKTSARTEVFATPLRDITMLWDTSGEGDHYLYTDPSGAVDGFVYLVRGGQLQYVTAGTPGLMAKVLDDHLLLSKTEGGRIVSEILSIGTGTNTPIGISMFPTKCAAGGAGLWCLAPATLPATRGGTYPDLWYQGAVSLNDFLWKVNDASGDSTLFMNIEGTAGRPLDGIGVSLNESGTRLLFINKTDGTPWLVNLERS